MSDPRISIVIPTYNRAAVLRRAVDSCVSQEFGEWEMIIADDASEDDTSRVVAGFADTRVRYLRLDKNSGVGPARNAGVAEARSEWLLFLDSDDELLPGALKKIASVVDVADASIDRLLFAYALEDGNLSPDVWPAGSVIDFEAYVRWAALNLRRSDWMNCIRRRAFQEVSWPATRAVETAFHYDFSFRFRSLCVKETVALIHTDAPNRFSSQSWRERRRSARDIAQGLLYVCERYGSTIDAIAPDLLTRLWRGAGTQFLVSGARRDGMRCLSVVSRRTPGDLRVWMTFLVGSISGGLLAMMQQVRRFARNR